ncbi:sulfotransferase domain-containing protein [Candidatus Neomarinimicrobiota bacterium]
MIGRIKNRLNRIRVNIHRFGFLKTLIYLFKNVVIKRPINQINYYLKRKKYPQNIIFITALPKSGSTWLSNMCADLDGFDSFAPMKWNTYISKKWDDSRWDLEVDTFKEFINKLAVIRGHTWAIPKNIEILEATNLKYIISVRDPRDKLISEYWHSRNFPGHWAHDQVHKLSIDDFITIKLESGEFEKETLNWIRCWLKNRDLKKSMIVRYQDLLDNTNAELEKIFNFLGFKIEQSTVKNIIEQNSFNKITGRKRGESDNTKFVRKGMAGEWKTIFSMEHKLLFSKIGEDIIKDLGYETTLYNG